MGMGIRRLMLALSLLVLGFASAPQPAAAAPQRALCEGYCGFAAGGCYVFLGLFIGKDKCDGVYRGCVDGCVTALFEIDTDEN